MALEKIKPRVVDATGNYTFNDINLTGNISAPTSNISNLTGVTNLVASSTTITVTGNVSTTSNVAAGNIKTDNLLYANGVAWSFGGGAGATVAGANTQIQFNDAGSFGASANLTFDKTSNTLTVAKISANGAGLTSLTGANVTGTVANATYAVSAGTADSATTAGTVTTAAQGNITSVGTLTSLGVTGNITSGNANLGNLTSSNYFSGNGSLLSSITGGNVTGAVAYATTANAVAGANVSGQVSYAATANAVAGSNVMGQVGNSLIAGTVYTNAQPNITSVGTLSSLNVTGNLSSGNANLGNLVIANYFSGNGSLLTGISAISAGYIANGNSNINIPSANGNIAMSVAGNANIIVVTGTGVNIAGYANLGSGNIITTGNASAGYFIGSGNNLSNIQGANVSGAVSYATTANAVAGANVSGQVGNALVAGTVYTNAQPNINSVGTLTGLTVGNATSNTVFGNGTITATGNISGGNLTLTGNLTVSGTTTTVNSTVTRVVDPIIELGGGANGAALSSDDNKDRGVLLHYYSGASTVDAFIGWDDSNAEFAFGSNVSVSSEVVTFNALGNVRANYIFGNAAYLTGVDLLTASGADQANYISNGNSNINTPISNGNITVSIAGVSNTVVFTSTGVNIAGYANLGTGNLLTTGNVSAGFFIGNGSQLTGVDSAGKVANGNSNVNIPTANGNITMGVAGNANIITVTGTGVNISGYANLGSGNLITTGNVSGNFILGNGYYLTGVDQLNVGNADGANFIANGTSNVNTPIANGNITVGIGGVSNTVVFTTTGVNIAGYVNATGNLTAGNITTSGSGGNISGANNISANTFTATGNISAGSNYFLGNGYYLTGIDAAGRLAN
jgi:hypothetical protein